MASRFLVAAQFAVIAVLCLPLQPHGRVAGGLGLVAAGLLGLAWTLRHNHIGNFNIRPESRAGARMVTTGPYRWVRHPMYLGVLVAAAGAVVIGPFAVKGPAWLALLIVLVAKGKMEEAALRRQFPDYEHYLRGRRFLIPGIW